MQWDRLYLEDHLHETISREQVAAIAHLNPNAFSRFFRQHTGLTYQDYLTNRRIGRACELLLDVSHSITDVAMECGFSTPTSFTRAFRRVKAMSPSTYRDQIMKVLR
jgi:AraC-like DNA-binding protein